MERCRVAPVAELKPGQRKLVDTARGSVGVFNVNGRYVALKNRCPHAGAQLCLGSVSGTVELDGWTEQWVRGGEILRCPWHQWEFDLFTGRTLDGEIRVQTYEVTVDDGWVVLHV